MFSFLILSALVITACVLGGWTCWERLFEADAAAALRHYRTWAIKGLGGPILVWIIFNSDLVPGLPALVLGLERSQFPGGGWFVALIGSTLVVAVIVAGYWMAATFGWAVAVLGREATERKQLVIMATALGLLTLPLDWLAWRFGGWGACGWALTLWLAPTARLALPMARKKPVVPVYSRAIARIKLGKYAAAEQEVIQQLEKCGEDYDGWMLLAELYATKFGDVLEADLTVRELCEQPNVQAVRVSLAFHRLADWYLNLAGDPAGAREALETIGHKFPGTHLARMAQMRIQQLPRSRAELLEQRRPKPIRLPALQDPLDERPPTQPTPEDRAEAVAAVNQWVERLKQDPNDVAVRERLAIALTEQLGKVELGLEQIELLLAMPDQPGARAAKWLGMMASWHLRYRQDWAAARPLLERLVHEFPETPQAFTAQRHLNLKAAELRLAKAASGVSNAPS